MNYIRSAATAKRLIEANGRSVTLIRKSRTVADATKPWRGPANATDASIGPLKAVIYPNEMKDERGGIVRLAGLKALIAHDSLDPASNLEDIDFLVDGAKRLKVTSAAIIGPGDTRIVYEFVLEE